MAHYLYTRCSTEEQNKKGNSHEYQISGLRAHPALSQDQELAVYSDTISGTTFERSELDMLYAICEAQPDGVEYIYVYRWDRFGRNVGEAFTWIKKFHNIGIEVNCPDQRIDFSDSNWPVILGIHLGMAQSESIKTSDRTRDGLYQANLQGYFTGSAPVGYTRQTTDERTSSGKLRRIMVPDDRAPFIAEAYRRMAAGESRAGIYSDMRQYLRVGKTQFYAIFTNPIYKGVIHLKAYKRYPATEVRARHAPIVDADLWQRVQDIIADQMQQITSRSWSQIADHQHDFYLKGIIKDAGTGRDMTAYYSRGRHGGRYGYYECKQTRYIVNADRAHRAIEAEMSRYAIDPDVLSHFDEVYDEITAPLRDRLSSVRKDLSQLQRQSDRLESDYLDGQITASDYSRLHHQLRKRTVIAQKEEVKIRGEISRIPRLDPAQFEPLTMLGDIYHNASNDRRSRLLKAIYPQGITIDRTDYTLRTPYINSLITINERKSMHYTHKKSDIFIDTSLSSVWGAKPNQFRTPHQLILQDIALLRSAI